MHCRSTQAPLFGSGSCLDPRLPAERQAEQTQKELWGHGRTGGHCCPGQALL